MNDRERDRRIDDQLRAAFAPPPALAFAALAQRVAGPHRAARPIWPWFAAAAALLAVVLILTSDWFTPAPRGPEGHDGAALGAIWVAAYEDAAARGFTGGCCEPGLDLPQACEELFACRVDVAASGSVAVVGGYSGLDTGGCMTVIARDGVTPVCVYIVPRDRDPLVVLPRGCTLHLARRELGQLVLYALSPAPAEAALRQFLVP